MMYHSDFPVSFAQEPMLLYENWCGFHSHELRQPILHFSVKIFGPVSVIGLERALNEIIDEQPALRTTFSVKSGVSPIEHATRVDAYALRNTFQPGLYVQTAVPARLRLAVWNVSFIPEFLATPVVDRLVRRQLEERFDLATGLLLRACLIERRSNEHLLVVAVPHIAADAWSIELIRDDLEQRYHRAKAVDTHERSPETTSKTEFSTFALAQHQALKAGKLDRSIRYWQEQWARYGADRFAATDLPFFNSKRNSGLQQLLLELKPAAFETVDVFLTNSSQVMAALKDVKVSLYSFCLASLTVLLHSYSHKPRIVIWSHFANRSYAGDSRTVGCFFHSNIIGTDLTGDPTIRSVIKEVSGSVLNAIAHQDVSAEVVWSSLGFSPIVRDIKILLEVKRKKEPLDKDHRQPDIMFEDIETVDPRVRRFANFVFSVNIGNNTASLSVRYSKSESNHLRMHRVLIDWRHLLSEFVAQLDAKLSEMPTVSALFASHGRDSPQASAMGHFVVNAPDMIRKLNVSSHGAVSSSSSAAF
jgi:hypothetical protein